MRSSAKCQGTVEEREQRYRAIYAVVHCIPAGCVLTYGQVGELAGMPGAARQVGAAMRGSGRTERGLPWHRVVGKRSRGQAHISIPDPVVADVQRAMLEAEGVTFSSSGAISLARHGWIPGDDEMPQRRSRRRRTAT